MNYILGNGFPYHRGRRLRRSQHIRDLVSETNLTTDDLVMPFFLKEDDDKTNTKNLYDLKRFTIKELCIELEKIVDIGIKAIAIFPKVKDNKKTTKAEESYNEKNLICRSLRILTKKFPKLIIICDVALDAYTSTGHDGVVNSYGEVDNDKTVEALTKMSISLVSSGCEIIAPSDMMDGRIKSIRENLESLGFKETIILSYSSKFCSNFYTPFRDAIGSSVNLGDSKKHSYQINFRNRKEALKESLEDINEGADIIMIKPAGYYLDIIREVRDSCLIPVAAFQVSGEYCLIKSAAERKLINLRDCVLESLNCIKRSGADLIFSYFSMEVAKWLNK
tara:strand:- start:918 stop:1922 length:1005 start_codon:yes stop_codon:yes gene_type:complete